MPDWLLSIPAFIIAIGVLVSVHEYGHFWVARKLGIRVLRFSVGFGPKIWGTTRQGTEYWLAAIPLGGYVKMLDEREGPVPEDQRDQAFNTQAPWKRILVVAAGPGVNFIFAIFAYWCVLTMGVTGLKPLLDDPVEGSPAEMAGVHGADTVLRLNGREVPTWHDMRLGIIKEGIFGEALELELLSPEGQIRKARIDLEGLGVDPRQLLEGVGLRPQRPQVPPVFAEIIEGGAAEAAGLQPGDRVMAFNGEAVDDWSQLVSLIRSHPEQLVTFRIERNGDIFSQDIQIGSVVDSGNLSGRLGAGVDVDPALWQDLRIEHSMGLLAAIPEAVRRTWDMSLLTLGMFGHMLLGDVSWENVSGPVQIASYAGQSASIGLEVYLAFLALVSVSLGVLNLLPIPVLDGGHLLYYSIEWVRGKPLSERIQLAGQKLGFIMLAALMTVALYNDFLHIFDGL